MLALWQRQVESADHILDQGIEGYGTQVVGTQTGVFKFLAQQVEIQGALVIWCEQCAEFVQYGRIQQPVTEEIAVMHGFVVADRPCAQRCVKRSSNSAL